MAQNRKQKHFIIPHGNFGIYSSLLCYTVLLRYFKKKRVAPRHILLTLRHDKELEELTKGAIVPEGGVRPFVHPQLLPKGAGSDEGAPEEHAPTTSTVQSQVL